MYKISKKLSKETDYLKFTSIDILKKNLINLKDVDNYNIIEKDINNKSSDIKNLKFDKEILKVINEDYYYSNVIARASKTMFECRNAKTNLKSTGTEG